VAPAAEEGGEAAAGVDEAETVARGARMEARRRWLLQCEGVNVEMSRHTTG